MQQITVTKEFTWDMAHMLADHQGLCLNLHGHTYRMHVEVARKSNDLMSGTGYSDGMVIDFKNLKEVVQEMIVDPLDHAFMYWRNSTDEVEHQLAKLLKENGRKVFEVSFRPTAEEMAAYFYETLSREFDRYEIDIISIKVWETPTSFAEVK